MSEIQYLLGTLSYLRVKVKGFSAGGLESFPLSNHKGKEEFCSCLKAALSFKQKVSKIKSSQSALLLQSYAGWET